MRRKNTSLSVHKWVKNASWTHYSKSQIFVQKFNFDKTLQFFSGNQSCQPLKSANPQHFHEFSPKFFLIIFLVKSKFSAAKKYKAAAFSRVFTHNNSTIFLGKSKLNFWTKLKISNSVIEDSWKGRLVGKKRKWRHGEQ